MNKWDSAIKKNNLNDMVKEAHRNSVVHNWWTDDDLFNVNARNKQGVMIVATKLALIHSEVSEALEGIRKGLNDDHLPDRPMVEVELADVVIRILDLSGALKIDLGGAVVAKWDYNQNRADHKKENRSAEGGKLI